MSLRIRSCLLVLAMLAFAQSAAQAQINQRGRSRYRSAAYYSYAEPDEVTIEVPVWGSVRNPGLYEIPTGTRLSELFSLAGGRLPAYSASVRIRRSRCALRVSRGAGGSSSSRKRWKTKCSPLMKTPCSSPVTS